jgi:hypothetical protein
MATDWDGLLGIQSVLILTRISMEDMLSTSSNIEKETAKLSVNLPICSLFTHGQLLW